MDGAPIGCPSMDAATIYEYMKYRTQAPGEKITSIDGSTAKDSNDIEILTIGGWSAPINSKQFGSAISALHVAKHQSGQYEDSCHACVQGGIKDENFMGCRTHRPLPKFHRKGNPRFATDIKNVFQWCQLKRSVHVVILFEFLLMDDLFWL